MTKKLNLDELTARDVLTELHNKCAELGVLQREVITKLEKLPGDGGEGMILHGRTNHEWVSRLAKEQLQLLDLLAEARGLVDSIVDDCGGCDDGVPLNCDDEDCECWETHACIPARAFLAKFDEGGG